MLSVFVRGTQEAMADASPCDEPAQASGACAFGIDALPLELVHLIVSHHLPPPPPPAPPPEHAVWTSPKPKPKPKPNPNQAFDWRTAARAGALASTAPAPRWGELHAG